MNAIKLMMPVVALACAVHASPLVVGVVDCCSPEGKPLPADYAEAVRTQGAEPRLLTWTDDTAAIERAVAGIDLLMLCGGEDVAPERYQAPRHRKLGAVNLRRDEFEWKLLGAAVRQHKPIFGICRGEQMINVYFGGTLWQDLPTEFPKHEVLHRRRDAPRVPVHDCIPTAGFMTRLFGGETMQVNSIHHQAVKRVAPGFTACAHAPDGVVEAIGNDALHVHGVQFHPERLFDRYAPWRRLFKFVLDDAAVCRKEQEAKKNDVSSK